MTGMAGLGIGLVIGSFLATLVLRWPQGRAVTGRSACDRCGVTLRWTNLVPVVSYLANRGTCTSCGVRIDRTHPLIELLCGAVGAAALYASPDLAGASAALICWMLVALAALDLRYFWLPDRLTVAVALVGLCSGALGILPSLSDRLIGGTTGYVALASVAWSYARIRRREGLGRGDPKLFGAIGMWLGWQELPFVLFGASVLGLLAVAAMTLRGHAVAATTRLPFGTLLAVAAFAVWLVSR